MWADVEPIAFGERCPYFEQETLTVFNVFTLFFRNLIPGVLKAGPSPVCTAHWGHCIFLHWFTTQAAGVHCLIHTFRLHLTGLYD